MAFNTVSRFSMIWGIATRSGFQCTNDFVPKKTSRSTYKRNYFTVDIALHRMGKVSVKKISIYSGFKIVANYIFA